MRYRRVISLSLLLSVDVREWGRGDWDWKERGEGGETRERRSR